MLIRFTPQSSNALTEMAGVPTTFTGKSVDETISVIAPASLTPATNKPSAPASR